MEGGTLKRNTETIGQVSIRQQGVVLTEYLVGSVCVAFALFAPVPGLGESAFVYLLDALRGFQANTGYLMSMP